MDLTPFVGNANEEVETCDLRSNPLQDGGDDGRRPSLGPTIRLMVMKIQED